MKSALFIFLMLLVMVGCSKGEAPGSTANASSNGSIAGKTANHLAYQHTISIDTEANKVAAIYESALASCRAADDDLCTVLESRISTGRDGYASLKFRAKPSGIKKVMAVLNNNTDVVEQSTTAEDLASPIEDATKKNGAID